MARDGASAAAAAVGDVGVWSPSPSSLRRSKAAAAVGATVVAVGAVGVWSLSPLSPSS